MVTFDRKNLIMSQCARLDRMYKDINFFVILLCTIVTIVSIVAMTFFSIAVGLWIEAVVIFISAMYYMIMSFIKERMMLGYYQKAKYIDVNATIEGLVLKQVMRDSEKDYLVNYNEISRVIVNNDFFVICLKNEGKIALPNTIEAHKILNVLREQLKGMFVVLK